MIKKPYLALLLGALVSLLGLWLAFRQVDFGVFVAHVKELNLLLIIVLILINFLVIGTKALRWQVILQTSQPVMFTNVFWALFIGYATGAFLPVKGGELVRVWVLGKNEKIGNSTVLGTTVLDHCMDALGSVPLLIVLPIMMNVPHWIHMVSWALFASLAVLLLLIKWVTHPDRLQRVSQWENRPGIWGWLARTLQKFGQGFSLLGSVKAFALAEFWSILSWLVQACLAVLVAKAVGLELSLAQGFLVVIGINLFCLVPSTPGAFGTFEAGAVIGLTFLGVDPTQASLFAVLLHLIEVAPVALVGMLCAPLVGTNLGTLVKSAGK